MNPYYIAFAIFWIVQAIFVGRWHYNSLIERGETEMLWLDSFGCGFFWPFYYLIQGIAIVVLAIKHVLFDPVFSRIFWLADKIQYLATGIPKHAEPLPLPVSPERRGPDYLW